MINKLDALLSLRPTGVWGDTSGKFGCDEGITLPTDAEIDAEVIRLQAEYDAQEYARKRKAEYDKLNQFEMQFDDKKNDTTTWVDKINEIKARYPK